MARQSDSPVIYILRDAKAKKPTPITCTIRFENQRMNIGTGFKAMPTHWNATKQRVKNVVDAVDKDVINDFLDRLEKAIASIIVELKSQQASLTGDFIGIDQWIS